MILLFVARDHFAQIEHIDAVNNVDAILDVPGIDGLIIPDLPIDYYEENYKSVFEKNQLYNMFLIAIYTTLIIHFRICFRKSQIL